MIRVPDIVLPLDEKDLRGAAARRLRISPESIRSLEIARRSVDARKKNDVKFVYTVLADVGGDEDKLLRRVRDPKIVKEKSYVYRVPVKQRPQLPPVVAGFGPAGMFSALLLAQAGLCPLVLERGYDADRRTEAVSRLRQSGVLDPVSNVQFGEGGAGTFSDGKLNTGVHDPRIRKVFEELVRFGAPEEILYEAKPHVGTDLLPGIVKKLREEVIRLGGEVRFCQQVTGLHSENGALSEIEITPLNGLPYRQKCERLILAVGHSARDTFRMLLESGIALRQKPFSVGVRIEHPQEVINKAQYGAFWNYPALGAADYKLSAHLPGGRGVYTFCMCPGGQVVCASSEEGGVVTNGMSVFARNGENANAALLVNVSGADFKSEEPLAGINFQREIEERAFRMGQGGYRAPAQRAEDFLEGRKSHAFFEVKPSYEPGVVPEDLAEGLPAEITDSLRQGVLLFDQKLRGFAMGGAVLTGFETRSSSPVRILRDDALESVSLRGLYPCGEGAGYAGGIVSAAVDGIKCAEKIIDKY